MDLSINKTNALDKKISFKGMEGAYDKNCAQTLKFYAPPHNKDDVVELDIVFLQPDKSILGYKKPEEKFIKTIPFKNDVIELPQDFARKISSGFAYRYKITDKNGSSRYVLDSFKSMEINSKGDRMNVIEQGTMYGVSPKGGTMYHGFLDSVSRIDAKTGNKLPADKEFVRNHFNKLGGSIKGMTWLLRNTDEMEPYRYIMTTPDIGVDKVSSHRYWPANQYQCSDLEAFKEFNFELFQQGKGYLADGAFTSQGIQSPLVQHVLKWGEESPFYDWLKMDGRPTLGVLPDVSEINGVNPYEHIGVRLVNPKGANYDKTKPTYIQFYDDRLLSSEKQADGKLHFDYDKAPDDHYDIVSHQDSVQPYAFEVDPNDKKLKAFNGKMSVRLTDIPETYDFLTFPNFTIGEKNKVSGATYWDGNVDIIKMNLSNPDFMNSKNVQGSKDARNYLLGVADYWTETIQSHLILETAKSPNKVQIAKNNGVENLSSLNTDIGFVSLVANNQRKTEEMIKNFPLQTLETSEELSAIFTQPQFREEFFTDKNVAQIQKMFDDVLNVVGANKGEEYKTYIKQVYGNEILRNIFAAALNPNAVAGGKINFDELKKVTLKSLETHTSNSPKEERAQVVSKLTKGLQEVNLSSLSKNIKKDLANVSLDDFKIAEAIVLQGKGGLNWRFDAAKDIGDLDAVRDGKKTFNQVWKDVESFWGDFVARIKKYNPSAYVINEVTSLNEFYTWNNVNSMKAFSPELAKAWENMSEEERGNWENHVPYALQVHYLDKTNSTTTSEFSKGFNSFSEFAGVNPEKEVYNAGDFNNYRKKAGDLSNLKSIMETLMQYNQPNSAIYSHMFTNNHDKPSVLHTMPLNMSVYMAKDMKELDDSTKKSILKLIGQPEANFDKIYKTICPKAVGVGLAMQEVINKSNYSDADKQKLTEALTKLVNGQKPSGGKNSYKRAESFGVKPYEITIKDLFRYAGMNPSDDNVLKFHYSMLKDSMNYYERLWQVMNACVGTPTLFAGGEFAQTGYETPSKNVYLGIRNEVMHDLANCDNANYNYKKYYDKMYRTSSLYKLPGMSALRDGAPIPLEMTDNKTFSMWPVYKKDAKGSEVVSVITNLGLPNGKASFETRSNDTIKQMVDSIAIVDKDGRCPFEDGVKLSRVGDNKTYIVENGKIVLKGGKIELTDTVINFFKCNI